MDRYCKDCRHLAGPIFMPADLRGCKAVREPCGAPTGFASLERKYGRKCGREGKLWEPRQWYQDTPLRAGLAAFLLYAWIVI